MRYLNKSLATDSSKRKAAKSLSASMLALTMASPALAQANEDAELVQDAIEVIGDPIGLLEDRPTDSVFGFGRSSLETPRAISIISADTIERYGIEDIDDFITTTPGTFGGTFFGVPGSITIRGSSSETYFRGFKRALNQGLFPTPIGSTDRVEIVRGPVPVIYGAGRVGGLLNFYPKSSKTEELSAEDGASGSLSYTGGDYNKNNFAAELTVPFLLGGRESGVSFYGEREDSKSFYRGREPEHDLAQVAFTHDLGDGWSMEVGGMYFNSDGYYQSPGWNRLTQDLVDNGTYITGIDTDLVDTNGDGQLNNGEVDAAVGTFFGASNIRTFVDFGVFGFPDAYGLDEGVGTTQLDPRDIFIDESSITTSESTTIYADLIKEFGASTLKLQAFYENVEGQLNVGYGFASDQNMEVFEARASYDFSAKFTDFISADIFTTASYRNYDSELNEHFLSGYLVLDRRDISAGATGGDIFATPLTDSTIAWDSAFASEYSDLGAAVIADIMFGDRVSLLLGGRYDYYEVEATDGGATTFGAATEGESEEGDYSYSASLSYKFDNGVVPYITYAEGSAPEYNANGGITPASAAADDFLSESELLEMGVKFAVLDDRFNGSLIYYEQERNRQDPFGNIDRESSSGVEAELRFLISDNFTVTGTATMQEFNIAAPGACGSGNGEFVVIAPTHPTVNAFGQTLTSAQGYGGLFSALNASCLPELQDGYERSVIPESVYSAFATYTSDPFSNGAEWGATLGATQVSETGGKTTGAVVLPDYITFRAALFGRLGPFSLTATMDNVFDEDYFQPVQGVYEEVAAFPGQGRVTQITATWEF